MKSKVFERNLVACVIALLAAVVPLFFAACRSDIISPLDPSAAQQASAPTIKSIVPDTAPPAGGAAVTINGSNFSSSAQATPPSVSFGGVTATNVRIVSSLQLVATVPPHSSGKVNVQVTTADGMSSSVLGAFTYTASSPAVRSISPASGGTAGGTAVTITGSNFASGATVSFGGAPASVSFLSSTQLKAVTPAHAAGSVNVVITNPDNTSAALPGGFTFGTSSSLAVSSVTPSSGGTAGGTVVTVTGSNFASGATVSFGGAPASVSFLSSTQLKAVTPAHAAGSVNVVITNPDNTSAMLSGGFTFGTTPLTVSSVTPSSGGTAGGTAVTITGSNFASGATVSFGGSAASGVSFVSANQLKATTPAHAAGSVSVMITNPDGTSGTLPGGFTFGTVSLAVSSVSPFSGPAAGGTKVTISGANFQAGVSVTFGGLPATSVTLTNSSTIAAVTPQHSSGAATVTITNTSGQSASWAKTYTFHSIDLLWDAPSASPVTIAGYNIYRGNSSAGPFGKLNGSTPLPDTSFNDTTVEGSTTYYYEVKSVDSDGTESAPAGPVPATTSP